MNSKYRKLVSSILQPDKSSSKHRYVSYIQSTGSEYIDTKIQVTDNNFKVTVDVLSSISLNNMTIGLWGNIVFSGSSISKSCLGIVNNRWFAGQGGTSTSSVTASLGIRTKLIFDMVNATFDVNGFNQDVDRLAGNKSNCFLFARNDGLGNPYGVKFTGRIYSCKVENGEGVLIQDLKPVMIIESGEFCMYDEISKSYFRNKGEGKFIGEIVIEEDVEYIQSDGLQYIDTKFIPKSNTGKTRIIVSTSTLDSIRGIYGYINESELTSNISISQGLSEDLTSNWIITSGINNFIAPIEYDLKTEIVWDRLKNTYSINGEEFILDNSTNIDLNWSAFLFNRNNNSNIPLGFSGKIYLYQEYDDLGNLIIDMRPKTSNNEFYMYDSIRDSYFLNSGLGKFTGPTPTTNYELTKYTQLNRQQWIDLGIKANDTDETLVVFKTIDTIGGFIFGARKSYQVDSQSAFANKSGINTLVFSGFGSTWSSRVIPESPTDGWITLEQNTNRVIINGVEYSSINNTVFETDDNIYLGRIASDTRAFDGYVTRLLIKKGGIAVYDLNSCIQKSTGIAGFWCNVNNRFYGSDTAVPFLPGPTITGGNKETLINYISVAENLTESNYTEESWKSLSTKLENAILINEISSDQGVIDSTAEELLTSITNLIEISPSSPNYEFQNLELIGTNYVNTKIKLFEEDKEFTIYIHYKLDASSFTTGGVNGQKVLFHCMEEIAPDYQGLTFQSNIFNNVTDATMNLSYNMDNSIILAPTLSQEGKVTDEIILCVRKTIDSSSNCKVNVQTFKPEPKNVSIADNIESNLIAFSTGSYQDSELLIGAADMVDRIDRYCIGDVYRFEYYDKISLTDEQILLKFIKETNK